MAVDDVNGDGWLDLYVCFSAYQTPARRKNKLFINNRDGTFTVVSEAAGISGEGYGLGVVVTDINRYTLFCGEQIVGRVVVKLGAKSGKPYYTSDSPFIPVVPLFRPPVN
jgi:hypothetical protein